MTSTELLNPDNLTSAEVWSSLSITLKAKELKRIIKDVFANYLRNNKYSCLKEFHPEVDSIRTYLELASLYFKANDIGEDKQVPIYLSSIGAQTYSLLRYLVAPSSPGEL